MDNITFELEENKQDIKRNKNGKQIFGGHYNKVASKIIIRKNHKVIGHIFTPGSSGDDIKNAIQICGFTEAFDLWGCGVFNGFKDIQLLFDEGIMGGVDTDCSLSQCCRCYRKPCQCETDLDSHNPFIVKRQGHLKKRIVKVNDANGEDDDG